MTRAGTIDEAIIRSLEKYFRDLDGQMPSGIYDMVIQAVERPLLEASTATPCARNS